jgi:uncharacterized membrane protein
MQSGLIALAFVFAGLIAASLPFFIRRIAGFFKTKEGKPFIAYALESFVLFAIVVAVAVLVEDRTGQRAPQGWEFYAVLVCLWAVLAFPGFLWRYLLKRPSAERESQEYE